MASPPGINCKQMAIDWPYGQYALGQSLFERDANGKGELLFSKVVDGATPYVDQVLAKADGPILFTLRQAGTSQGCAMNLGDFNEGVGSLDVTGDGSTPNGFDSNVNGLIVVSVASTTPVLAPLQTDNGEQWHWYVGKKHLIKAIAPSRVGEVYSPDFKLKTQLWPPLGGDPDNLPYEVGTRIVGSDVIFQVSLGPGVPPD